MCGARTNPAEMMMMAMMINVSIWTLSPRHLSEQTGPLWTQSPPGVITDAISWNPLRGPGPLRGGPTPASYRIEQLTKRVPIAFGFKRSNLANLTILSHWTTEEFSCGFTRRHWRNGFRTRGKIAPP